jgi:hypothetical protein
MPIQYLFTKKEQRILAGEDKEELIQRAAKYWNGKGYRVDFRGPFLFHAEQFESHLGLRKVVDLSITDYNQAFALDLTLSATLGDTGALVGAVGVLVIPVAAVVVGGLSYLDYDQNANRDIMEFWQVMFSSPGAHSQPKSEGQECTSCGATLDQESAFCKKCGARVG